MGFSYFAAKTAVDMPALVWTMVFVATGTIQIFWLGKFNLSTLKCGLQYADWPISFYSPFFKLFVVKTSLEKLRNSRRNK